MEEEDSSVHSSLLDVLYFSDENGIPSEKIQQAAEKVEGWWQQAQVQGLVARQNEVWDDIPTNQTVVLLFPFLLGMAKISNSNWEQREQRVKEAINYFTIFLQKMNLLHFLSKEDQKQVEWAIQSLQGTTETKLSDSEKRQRKIELFKQQKLWKQKVEALSELANNSKKHMEEELQREWMESKLRLAVYKVIGMSQHLREELNLLVYGKQKESGTETRESQRIVNTQPAFIKLGRMRFSEPIVKQPPSFRIPDDDPCFPLQHQHNHQRQHRKPSTKVEQKELTEDDVEIYKQRKWDDWKDDHNRGSGNTLR
ncbi:PP2A regulatory subunit TAP46 [Galdieria sulphuraria]|nr:PP2A regulatory subunit TAP46 [Galdieria sulphuraria]